METIEKIAKLRTLYIFLLVSLPVMIKYQSTNNPSGTLFFTILNMFGHVMLLLWYYSIGKVCVDTLKTKDIEIKEVEVFNLLLLLYLPFDIYFSFYATDIEEYNMTWIHVTIPKPVGGYFFSLIMILYIIHFIAKLIKSSELGKLMDFKQYYKIFLLLLIPYIGLLFVHYRISDIINKKEITPLSNV
jgi:hypothetical protein